MKLEVKHLPPKMRIRLEYYRKQYAVGLLPKDYINTFEKENLLHLLFNSEQTSNYKTTELCEFVKKHNRFPTPDSEDTHEKMMAKFMSSRRLGKRGKKGNFYESDQKIAESFGIPNLFISIDLEKVSNENTKKACEFYKLYNRLPFCHSKDQEEVKLSSFIGKRRSAKKGVGRSKFYESDQKIAESYGLPNLFDPIDLEKVSNENTKKVCEFYKTNSRLPSKYSKDEEEKKLGAFLVTRRDAKKKKKYTFYDSDQKIAESYGLPHLFDTKDKA